MSVDDAYEVHEAFEKLRSGKQTVLRGRSVSSADAAQIVAAAGLLLSNEKPSRWPAQPPPGSVLRFERRFAPRIEAKAYTYVAIRIDAGDETRWHVTGRRQLILSWDELVNLIGDSPCWLVTTYQEIPRPTPDPLETISNPVDWFTAAFGGGVEHKEEKDD